MKNGKGYQGDLADIFSAGSTLFEMVVGDMAFETSSADDRNYKLISNEKMHERFWITTQNMRDKHFE